MKINTSVLVLLFTGLMRFNSFSFHWRSWEKCHSILTNTSHPLCHFLNSSSTVKHALVVISVWSCYLYGCKVARPAAVVFVWCVSTVSSVRWCQCSCAPASCCWWPLDARPVPRPPPRDWARPCYCPESSDLLSDLQSRWKQKASIVNNNV